jgi:hypothetical protein
MRHIQHVYFADNNTIPHNKIDFKSKRFHKPPSTSQMAPAGVIFCNS